MERPSHTRIHSSGRLFNNNADSAYVFPADNEEARRLNEQHACLTSAIGRLILPDIDLHPGDRVLDAATGTGVWLLDCLSKSPPDVSFVGVDISPHLFPTPDRTPLNATFTQHSVLALPQEWTGSFALVNQRLLIAALRPEEWPRALQEHWRMLRPGGWLQLCEATAPPPGAPLPPGGEMYIALAQASGTDVRCAPRLSEWLSDAGFIHISRSVRHLPLRIRTSDGKSDPAPSYAKLWLEAHTSLKDAALKVGIVKSEQEYDQYLASLRTQVETTDAHLEFHWVWAQKPAEPNISSRI